MNVVFLKIKTTMYFYLKYLIISIVVNVVDVVSVFLLLGILDDCKPLIIWLWLLPHHLFSSKIGLLQCLIEPYFP